MNDLMTIQAFSLKTGIPKSSLRFYEEKNLLMTKRHRDNDYRIYTEEQVPTAKLIASLRAADIPILDIQFYLLADEVQKQKLKTAWIKRIRDKQRQLDISLHYLETNQSEAGIFLFEKPCEKVVWFLAESAPGEFKEDLIARRNELKENQIPVKNIYFKFLSGDSSLVKAEIGFGIKRNAVIPNSIDGIVKNMDVSMCIGLSYSDSISNIISGYRKLYQYCFKHNWIPAGSVIEWYRGDQIDELDLIMPITTVEELK